MAGSVSSSRGDPITPTTAITETKNEPIPQAHSAEGQPQVHANVASRNIHPPVPDQAESSSSSQAAPEAASSGVTARRGLAPSSRALALPNQGGLNNPRSQSAMRLDQFTRARSPSSRSVPRGAHNQSPSDSPPADTFPNLRGVSESKHSNQFDQWDMVETKQTPLRESALTDKSAASLSPLGSPLNRSPSSLGSPVNGYASGQASPSASPVASGNLRAPVEKQGLGRSASTNQISTRSFRERLLSEIKSVLTKSPTSGSAASPTSSSSSNSSSSSTVGPGGVGISSSSFTSMARPAMIVYTPRADLDWGQLGNNKEFNRCLESPTVRSLFAAHLETEFSIENLQFLERCILFLQVPTPEKLTDLLTDFVGDQAQLQINLSSELTVDFRNVVNLADAQELILLAQAEVYNTVSRDPFARFKTSQAFKDFLNSPEGAGFSS